MHIVIPCKSLQTGKSRLSACLNGPARRNLCRQMLTRTLECAVGAADPSKIRVLTSDAAAAAVAQFYLVTVMADLGGGLNSALEVARAALIAAGSLDDALLIMPIDLPFASTDSIAAAQSRGGDVVIAADQSGSGTNLLLLRGSALRRFGFRYGVGSYAAHLAQARDNGLAICELNDWRLAFDVDDATQYSAWRSQSGVRS
jgi:2-phospho-L-lactate/phosphoenolpyruvate guanylyltransferase